MPNGRTSRRSSRRRRSRSSRYTKSATSIAALWRGYRARKKGGLVTRTALSNRKAIKKLKNAPEVKYLTSGVCQESNNWTGQTLVAYPDCVGFNNQLNGISNIDPNNAGTAPNSFNFKPIVMRPLYCFQGDGEGQRIAEYIQMKWINIKGSVTSFACESNGVAPNGTNYNSRAMKQTVRLIVVLDKSPRFWDPTVATFQPDSNPGYVYDMKNLTSNYGPTPITNIDSNMFLRSGPKAPFGSIGADSTCDPWSTSYWENDYVQSSKYKNKRFKVLKVLTLKTQQPSVASANPGGTALPSRRDFSCTLKLPYKFQYRDANKRLPVNQEILIFAVSDVKVPITIPGVTDNQAPVTTPKLTLQCKVAFTDS